MNDYLNNNNNYIVNNNYDIYNHIYQTVCKHGNTLGHGINSISSILTTDRLGIS